MQKDCHKTKQIDHFCCLLQDFNYTINWKLGVFPSVVLKMDIAVFMSCFFLITHNSQAFAFEDCAYKKLKWEFIFKM